MLIFQVGAIKPPQTSFLISKTLLRHGNESKLKSKPDIAFIIITNFSNWARSKKFSFFPKVSNLHSWFSPCRKWNCAHLLTHFYWCLLHRFSVWHLTSSFQSSHKHHRTGFASAESPSACSCLITGTMKTQQATCLLFSLDFTRLNRDNWLSSVADGFFVCLCFFCLCVFSDFICSHLIIWSVLFRMSLAALWTHILAAPRCRAVQPC